MMTRELLKHKAYYEFSGIWMDTLVHKGGRETGLTNTNKLIRFYKGCDAGKTGYTNEAKHCISASAMRDGTRLIAVVIGADSSQERFQGAEKAQGNPTGRKAEIREFGGAGYGDKRIRQG